MKLNMLVSGIVAVSTLGAMTTAQAHEGRIIGPANSHYQMFLGSNNEPAFVGFENGIDIFPQYCDKPCANPAAENSGKGVTLTLDPGTTEVLFWPQDDAGNTYDNATYKATMADPRVKFGTDGTASPDYQNHFLPTIAGAYGYHIVGKIKKAGKKAQAFDEVFICGAGTQSTTSEFGCFNPPQKFPEAGGAARAK